MSLDLGLAARVISAIRTQTAQRTGCGEWDTPGIAAALRSTQGTPGAVLAAAALAAEDASLRHPSERAFLTHWPKQADAPIRRNDDTCGEHALSRPCPACADAAKAAPVDPAAIANALAQARAELAKGLDRLHTRPTPGRAPTPGPQETR